MTSIVPGFVVLKDNESRTSTPRDPEPSRTTSVTGDGDAGGGVGITWWSLPQPDRNATNETRSHRLGSRAVLGTIRKFPLVISSSFERLTSDTLARRDARGRPRITLSRASQHSALSTPGRPRGLLTADRCLILS